MTKAFLDCILLDNTMYHWSIDDEELTGLAGIEPLLEIMGTKDTLDYSNLPFHPLLAPEILTKVFSKLKGRELFNCRLVCRTWSTEVTKCKSKELNLTLDSSNRNISDFFQLMKTPYAQFPSRHVILEDNDKTSLAHPQVLGFLEEFGNSVSSLVLNTNNSLNYLPFCLLPNLCKRLETLAFEVLEIPESFPNLSNTIKPFYHNTQIKSFPFLKNLMVNMISHPSIQHAENDNDNPVGKFVSHILDNSPNLTGLSLTDFSYQDLDYIGSELATKHLYIVQNLTNLRVDGHEKYFRSLIGNQLNLKWLHVPSLSKDCKTSTFAQLLEAISHSLEVLVVTNDYLKFAGTSFNIQFNCEMKRLVKLQIDDVLCVRGGRDTNNISLFKLLPALTNFQFVSDEIETYISDPERLGFWNCLFPDGSKVIEDKDRQLGLKTTPHKHLIELWLCTRLNEVSVVSEIQKMCPCLSYLKLEIEETLFSHVIDKLKDLPIKSFTLRYLELSENGIMSFVSALIGIDKRQCDQLLNKPDRDEKHLNHEIESCCPLEHWKYLSKLEISYKAKTGRTVMLNRFAICQGFLKIKNLKTLRLRHFEIEERFVVKILKKLPLTELNLTCCKILGQTRITRIRSKDFCNSSSELEPYSDHYESDIFKTISDRFPNVLFVYELDY